MLIYGDVIPQCGWKGDMELHAICGHLISPSALVCHAAGEPQAFLCVDLYPVLSLIRLFSVDLWIFLLV